MTIDLGLGHRYRMDEMLAGSTCGDIWAATWLQTGTAVAVKTLRKDAEAAHIEALRREGEHLRRLSHRYIVRCLKLGLWRGRPLLVLERLPASLKAVLASSWAQTAAAPAREIHRPPTSAAVVDETQALNWARQVARALHALHRSGRRHLDLKPANLLCSAPGATGHRVLKLADFGACLANDGALHTFVGTPGWAAPEQCTPVGRDTNGQPLFATCAASDWYALGELLHRLLTGRLSPAGAQRLTRYREGGMQALADAKAQPPLAMAGCPNLVGSEDDMATWRPATPPALQRQCTASKGRHAGLGAAPGSSRPLQRLAPHGAARVAPCSSATASWMALLLSVEPSTRIEGAAQLLAGKGSRCA